jgi:hypothetical protein
MQKNTIFLVLGITSLVLLACSFGGITQQRIQTQTTFVTATDALDSDSFNNQTEGNLGVVETLKAENPVETKEIENTPTPTIDPIDSNKFCLSQTWEVKGLNEYILTAVPPDLAEEYDLAYEDTTGSANMALSADGEAILNTENLVFHFSAKFGIFQVPVTVSIDGSAFGRYDIDLTTIRFYDMDTTGMTASAKALNEELMEPEQIIDSIPFVSPPFNTANYSCEGDTLKLKLDSYQADIPLLIFQAKK